MTVEALPVRRFLSVQVPFADLRVANESADRLARPTWPDPRVGHDFVRGAGVTTSRRRGGSPLWLGEGAFSKFSRALRYEDPSSLRHVYTRLFGSRWGYRLDMGHRCFTDVDFSDKDQFNTFVRTVFDRRVSVKEDSWIPLRNAWDHIGEQIEKRTQRQSVSAGTGRLRCGRPLLLIEDAFRGSRQPSLAFDSVSIGHDKVDALRLGRGSSSDESQARKEVRLFRLAWWRAHSEIEVLRMFLRAWRANELRPSSELLEVLHGIGSGLVRWQRNGFNQPKIIALRATRNPEQWQELLDMADLLLMESKGISRQVSMTVERARATSVTAEILSANPQATIALDVMSSNYKVEIHGGTGIAVGQGAHTTNVQEETTGPGPKHEREVRCMDPVSVVVAAVVAGAASGAGNVASKAISDSYGTLKALIKRAFSQRGNSSGEQLLDGINSEVSEEEKSALEAEMRKSHIDQDEAILKTAQDVLAKADPAGSSAGKYNVNVSGGNVQGMVVGDNANQRITFENPS